MKKKFPLASLMLLFCLIACTPQASFQSTTGIPSLSSTQTTTNSPSPSITATKTQKVTSTRKPTITKKPTSTPTIEPTRTEYPTFMLSENKTFTPPAPARCPVENPELQITPENPDSIAYEDYYELFQNLLNEGVSYQRIIQAYQSDIHGMHVADLTGDGIDEMIVISGLNVGILGCDNGEYELLLDYDSYGIVPPSIFSVHDNNLNGIPDLFLEFTASSGGNTGVDILEWNGEEFVSLILTNHGKGSETISPFARALYWYGDLRWSPIMNGSAIMEVKDLDRNGTNELILTDDGPKHLDTLYTYGPWRGIRVVFTWDGLHFLYSDLEMDSPEYRFQAVQDADRYFLLGKYDEALALYQEAIFNDQLEWWSPDRQIYIMKQGWGASDEENPVPEPNPDEYSHLAAYVRYRIMLHHVVRGSLSDAEVVYDTLLRKFPAGTVGYEFAEMATLFWKEYQASEDMASACEPVIIYARENPVLFDDLGNSGDRMQSHQYVPEDICPFS